MHPWQNREELFFGDSSGSRRLLLVLLLWDLLRVRLLRLLLRLLLPLVLQIRQSRR